MPSFPDTGKVGLNSRACKVGVISGREKYISIPDLGAPRGRLRNASHTIHLPSYTTYKHL